MKKKDVHIIVPPKMPKSDKIKMQGKINLLEENVCELACKCGWNLWIGGKYKKDLIKIKKFLKELYPPSSKT